MCLIKIRLVHPIKPPSSADPITKLKIQDTWQYRAAISPFLWNPSFSRVEIWGRKQEEGNWGNELNDPNPDHKSWKFHNAIDRSNSYSEVWLQSLQHLKNWTIFSTANRNSRTETPELWCISLGTVRMIIPPLKPGHSVHLFTRKKGGWDWGWGCDKKEGTEFKRTAVFTVLYY